MSWGCEASRHCSKQTVCRREKLHPGKNPSPSQRLNPLPSCSAGRRESGIWGRGEPPRDWGSSSMRTLWRAEPGPCSDLILLPGRETEAVALGRDGVAQQCGQEGDASCCCCCWNCSGTPTLLPETRAGIERPEGKEEKGMRCKGGNWGPPAPQSCPSTMALAGLTIILPLPSLAAGGQSSPWCSIHRIRV